MPPTATEYSALVPVMSEDGDVLIRKMRKGDCSWLTFPFFCQADKNNHVPVISNWQSELINLSQMNHCYLYILRLWRTRDAHKFKSVVSGDLNLLLFFKYTSLYLSCLKVSFGVSVVASVCSRSAFAWFIFYPFTFGCSEYIHLRCLSWKQLVERFYCFTRIKSFILFSIKSIHM